MKRICVFAHWDKDNQIDEYVIYYLQALKRVVDSIIFVSDCDLSTIEIEKITLITTTVLANKHGEYDFGSYKRGINYILKHHLPFDEILLVNDSCYGPFYPLENIFKKMSTKKCDYWGLTKNSYGITKQNDIDIAIWEPHIQSYFLLLKSQVVNSKKFLEFINNIKVENNKTDIIINYEIGLTKLLTSCGFKSAIYVDKYSHTENCLASKWKKMIIKYKFPFIKTSIIKNGLFVLGEVKDWREVISSISDYPIEYIEYNANKQLSLMQNLYKDMNLYRKIRFKLLNNMPMEFRKIVIYLEKNIFIILNNLCFNKLKKF